MTPFGVPTGVWVQESEDVPVPSLAASNAMVPTAQPAAAQHNSSASKIVFRRFTLFPYFYLSRNAIQLQLPRNQPPITILVKPFQEQPACRQRGRYIQRVVIQHGTRSREVRLPVQKPSRPGLGVGSNHECSTDRQRSAHR